MDSEKAQDGLREAFRTWFEQCGERSVKPSVSEIVERIGSCTTTGSGLNVKLAHWEGAVDRIGLHDRDNLSSIDVKVRNEFDSGMLDLEVEFRLGVAFHFSGQVIISTTNPYLGETDEVWRPVAANKVIDFPTKLVFFVYDPGEDDQEWELEEVEINEQEVQEKIEDVNDEILSNYEKYMV